MRNILSFLFLLSVNFFSAQITLTHNVGNTPIQTDMFSCEFAQSWSRKFKLSDFGVSSTEKFKINSGEVAIYNSLGGASLQFNIYKVDTDFPNSFSITNLIGSSQIVPIPIIGENPEIVSVNFDVPVIIPDGVEYILVDVRKFYDVNKRDTSTAYIAGTENDNDISWYWGCHNVYSYTDTKSLDPLVNNANFYINVTGELVGTNNLGFNTTLTHNLCNDVVKVNQYSCSWGGLKYARTFVLADFGVSQNEEFIIDKGQVAFSSVGVYDVKIQFNIYKIDDNFPNSYSSADLIGSSQIIYIPYFGTGGAPKIFDILFGTPITVPANVDKILVEVYNLDSNSSAGLAFIAGGSQNNDISWLRSEASGCPPFKEYRPITNPAINYFITVSGKTNHVTNNFEMNISNICSEFLKEFSIEKKENVASVVWNFGDPVSGTNNNSTDVSPFHDFSQDGIYTIMATVTGNDGSVEVLTETIDVREPPNAYGIDNIYACEDFFNTGIASNFDTSNVLQQVLGGQTNKMVTFIDGNGNTYDVLPNPFTNTVRDRETITVRISHSEEPCCYSEITFDLVVNPKPNLESVADLILCSNETNGFAEFNLQEVKDNIISNSTNLTVVFYRKNGDEILAPLNAVQNMVVNEEEITVRIINTDTDCYNETVFKLKVNSLPVANTVSELIGCDDNNDGISEYFDTTNIETMVLGNQMGMDVSYFDENGNQLPSPLPNPYTNTIANQEKITVRVTNPLTTCYSETLLILRTASKPQIDTPQTKYSCDLGNGYANFDTSNLETEILGNQTGLKVMYFDEDGNELESPLPITFQNTRAWTQTIIVRVENELNDLCFTETSFDLVVNQLPTVAIESAYFLCNLEPSLNLSIDSGLDSYFWQFENGTIISNANTANLVDAGNYKLTIGQNNNGIYCENVFDFELIRSELPNIIDVEYKELSDENFIKIIASGDGDFEYSIDGVKYQNSNTFSNVLGGIYTVEVRDKQGCGNDFETVVVLDCPKYFTPNNDGVNDTWQIRGISSYPNSEIFIYDRYGKLLKQLYPNGEGWDGTYSSENMPSSDYWFTVIIDNINKFTGHFTLKR